VLFDVKRITLRPCRDEIDKNRRNVDVCTEHQCELRTDQRCRVLAIELVERDFVEVRQIFHAEPAPDLGAWTVGEHDQHAETRERSGDHFEQIARQRVEPVAVFEHDDQRHLARSRAKAFDKKPLE
jgi:hypothetical protein